MNLDAMPKTLALIPDGNRRWSMRHKLSVLNGYNIGVRRFIEFAEWCMSYGIDSITVWAFSSDNFSRPKREIDALFSIYKHAAHDKKLIARLHKNRTRVQIIGDKEMLPKDLRNALQKLEVETSKHKDRVLNLLIGYGGREDILHAAKKAAETLMESGVSIESAFEKSLLSYGVPNLDLIIRTSGEHRLSGFMPWQSNYSELYFSKKLWPDFTKADLRCALADYSKRQRRFGK